MLAWSRDRQGLVSDFMFTPFKDGANAYSFAELKFLSVGATYKEPEHSKSEEIAQIKCQIS